MIGADQDIPSYEEVGAILTLGPATIDGDRAEIPGCGAAVCVASADTLERTESQGWVVTGTTGPVWIA